MVESLLLIIDSFICR